MSKPIKPKPSLGVGRSNVEPTQAVSLTIH